MTVQTSKQKHNEEGSWAGVTSSVMMSQGLPSSPTLTRQCSVGLQTGDLGSYDTLLPAPG